MPVRGSKDKLSTNAIRNDSILWVTFCI